MSLVKTPPCPLSDINCQGSSLPEGLLIVATWELVL
jgi:hypothetical protein